MARDLYRVRRTHQQECVVCGLYFVSNKPADTCSNACRQAYYRARKAVKEEAAKRQIPMFDAVTQ